jgi:hypothetical protein
MLVACRDFVGDLVHGRAARNPWPLRPSSIPLIHWEVFRSALACRDARRRTRTTNLSNSNSFTGTNNRSGLTVELVANFMIVL